MADEEGEKPADQTSEAKADTNQSEAATGASEASAEKASGGDTPSEPKKKKKKKKKKRSAEAKDEKEKEEEGKRAVLGPEGWERPGFVLDFPKDPELDRLVRAFELGNYAFVREHGKKLAESSSDEGVKNAAGELLRRIEPDPLVKILFAMSIGLLLFMVFYAYRSHGH
jgi:hypothetical protein